MQDILAYMTFPLEDRSRIYSTNPLVRLNMEINGGTDVAGELPDEPSVIRQVAVSSWTAALLSHLAGAEG